MLLLEVHNIVFVIPLVIAVGFVLLMACGLIGGDHDAPSDSGVLGPADAGIVGTALSFFGVGKVPFAIVLVSASLFWGVTGLAVNTLHKFDTLLPPVIFAGLAAVFGTRWLALAIARVLPSVETYSVANAQLVSERAEVIHEVNSDGGVVRLVDSLGTQRDLQCRVPRGHPPVRSGRWVTLTGYDESSGIFMVELQT